MDLPAALADAAEDMVLGNDGPNDRQFEFLMPFGLRIPVRKNRSTAAALLRWLTFVSNR